MAIDAELVEEDRASGDLVLMWRFHVAGGRVEESCWGPRLEVRAGARAGAGGLSCSVRKHRVSFRSVRTLFSVTAKVSHAPVFFGGGLDLCY